MDRPTWWIGRVIAIIVGFFLLVLGQVWKWAADTCSSGCDRWSYNGVVVFIVTYGPLLLLVLVMLEGARSAHREEQRRRTSATSRADGPSSHEPD